MGKRKSHLFAIIKNLIKAHIARISDIATLASLEATLARKTLLTIIILGGITIILFISCWLSLLAWFFLYLLSFHLTPMLSAFILFLSHLFILGLVLIYIIKIKKRLFFPATRRQITNLSKGIEEA